MFREVIFDSLTEGAPQESPKLRVQVPLGCEAELLRGLNNQRALF